MRTIGLGWAQFATRWSSNKDAKIGTVAHLRKLLVEILEHEVTVRRMRELPEEAALPQQIKRDLGQLGTLDADARTVRIASFALAASVCMYTFHQESLTLLSAEAPPFFPEELRSLWLRAATQLAPPPANFPLFPRLLECDVSPPGSNPARRFTQSAARRAALAWH